MSTSTIKAIRREVKAAKGIEDGAVVKFDRTMPADYAAQRHIPETITYAAIFVGGRWFLTGRGTMASKAYTSREFFDRLAEPDVSNVQVATEFEAV